MSDRTGTLESDIPLPPHVIDIQTKSSSSVAEQKTRNDAIRREKMERKAKLKGRHPFTTQVVPEIKRASVTGEDLVKKMRGEVSGGMTPKIMAIISDTKGRVDGVPHKELDDLRVVERDKITGRPTKWSK